MSNERIVAALGLDYHTPVAHDVVKENTIIRLNTQISTPWECAYRLTLGSLLAQGGVLTRVAVDGAEEGLDVELAFRELAKEVAHLSRSHDTRRVRQTDNDPGCSETPTRARNKHMQTVR